jgi:hypothetical protein
MENFDPSPWLFFISAIEYRLIYQSNCGPDGMLSEQGCSLCAQAAVDIWNRFKNLAKEIEDLKLNRFKNIIQLSNDIQNRFELRIPDEISKSITVSIIRLIQGQVYKPSSSLFNQLVIYIFEGLRRKILPLYMKTPDYEKMKNTLKKKRKFK